MAKTNYTFEKRQKEIAKKQKKAEKLQRKIALKVESPQPGPLQPASEGVPDPGPAVSESN